MVRDFGHPGRRVKLQDIGLIVCWSCQSDDVPSRWCGSWIKLEPAAIHILLLLKIRRSDKTPWSVVVCSSPANMTLMTSSSTTTSSLKRRAAVSRSSTSRSASVVAIAATVGDGSSDVGTVWIFVCPMSLLSTVVTDVVGFVTLLFSLEL